MGAMSPERIERALEGASDTEAVVIGEGVLPCVPDVFARLFAGQSAILVADENTLRAAGAVVRAELGARGRLADTFIFPGRPVLHADYRNIEPLAEWLRERDGAPVAVGSGSLNDIVKRAAHECGRAYMNVATAASVDGYAAFGASITRDGFKETMECRAPRAVVADLDVLAHAPAKMTAAGYADLLAKIPAGADWIIADELQVEPIDPAVWSLVQDPLREATGRPADLQDGEPAAIAGLIEGLIMSGLAMQASSSSRPASGAEHQFSHLWEMEGLGEEPVGDEPPLSHGFKVGLGTVSVGALYERLLERDLAELDAARITGAWPSWAETERRIRSGFAEELVDAVAERSRRKYVERDRLADRLALLRARWPALRDRLAEQLLPARQLRDQLRRCGCPTTPSEIGLTPEKLRDTYRRAQMIRPRYTVLDLLNDTGLLDACVGELFAPGGFWHGVG